MGREPDRPLLKGVVSVANSDTFVDFFRDIRKGQAAADLTEQLTALVVAVRSTGRPGKLVVTLLVKPASKGNVEMLMIEDQVKVTLPNPEKGGTVFFATDDNVLQRHDPRQPELSGLRQVVQHFVAQRATKEGTGP